MYPFTVSRVSFERLVGSLTCRANRQSKWMRDTAPFSLKLVHSPSRSIGDAMRDLDQKQLIKGDFICVYGDVVANIPLDAALAAHRARREKDKKAIMTMVLREAGNVHRTQTQHMRPCFVIEPEKGRCVHYEQVRPHEHPRLDIPEEVFKDHVEVEIRQDLIDCGIDICTPEVLAQWSDNFDWQMPRRGFLYGVLKDYETFQLTIHTHVVTDGYAARVRNLRAYDAISKDVLSRWTYPLCPDTNLLVDQSYQLQKGNVYKEDGVVLARSCKVDRKCVLGKATSIGDRSVITNSVVGRRCVIGSRVRIDGAYIWDDAHIGDETTVERAVIASEASVGNRCSIRPGALISYGVNIASGTTIESNTRVTKKRKLQNDRVTDGPTDLKIVGQGGSGFQMELDEEEEEVTEALLADVQRLDLSLTDDPPSDLESDDEDAELYEQHARSSSFASIGSEEGHRGAVAAAAADFHHEAVNSIFDSLQKGDDPDTIQLELTALTLSSNADARQIRRAVAVAFTKRIANLLDAGKSPKDAVAVTVAPNQRLIKGCVEGKSVEEQAEFLLFLQMDLVHRPQGPKVLLFVSNALATGDLVEAEGFERWWGDERGSATEELREVRGETEQLVEVLVGDDDEEDED